LFVFLSFLFPIFTLLASNWGKNSCAYCLKDDNIMVSSVCCVWYVEVADWLGE
jgi:hypothetical protein